MSECQTKAGNQECLNVWMFWTTFVFMCKLKSDCLLCYLSHVIFMSNVKGQMLILILGTCRTTFVFMSMLKSHWLFEWNWQCVFFDLISITLPCYFRCHRAGSQLKIKSDICCDYESFFQVSKLGKQLLFFQLFETFFWFLTSSIVLLTEY